MAKIFLCAGADAATISSSLTGLGHTVTTTSQSSSNAALDTAWGAGHDVIFVYNIETYHSPTAWLAAKYAAGIPVLANLRGGWATSNAGVGIAHTASSLGTRTDTYVLGATAHPITAGYSGTVTTGTASLTYYGSTAPGNPPYGTPLAIATEFDSRSTLSAIETGDAIDGAAPLSPGPTAPARAVVAGWLRYPVTADGLTIVGRSIDWLAGAAPTPTGSATLAVATEATGAVTIHNPATATLAVTTSVVGEITVAADDQAASATLAVTTTVTGAITTTTPHTAAATLGISVSVSGAITTDGELPTVALDNLSFTVHRAPPFHRVKVQGKRGSISYSYAPAPRLVACTAPDEVRLTVGDPTAELWLEAPDGQWWLGDLHQPHAPQLAANTTAFARTEGSWAGGRVETDEGDLIRWATAADFTITVELVGPAAVKVTLGPGAGLAAGEFYVNKPPTDVGLPVEVERRALPVFTAWSVSRSTIDVVGYSAPIGASTRPDYVHEAGFGCGFDTGPRTPAALAQDIATRAQQPGELMLDCPPDDVQVGQRWTTRVDATAGLVGDVVVLGRPDLTWTATQQSMTLRVWAMSITPT